MSIYTASAPAKIILFGEHAVVYGEPAVAVPISSVRAEATFKPGGSSFFIEAQDLEKTIPVEINRDLVEDALSLTIKLIVDHLRLPLPNGQITLTSSIPLAAGLGSGAAVSTALARSLIQSYGQNISNHTLNAIIYQVEKLHHGIPSGIDNTVIVHEKPVYFIKGNPIEIMSIHTPFTLMIADTGHPASTRLVVSDVRQLYEDQPNHTQPIITEIGQIAQKGRFAIEKGDLEQLGLLMIANHKLLKQLTVSSLALDHLVEAALSAGAIGAKLSGGGRGGNMIAMATSDRIENVKQALIKSGAKRVFSTEVK